MLVKINQWVSPFAPESFDIGEGQLSLLELETWLKVFEAEYKKRTGKDWRTPEPSKPELDDAERALVVVGNKIAAIKHLRARIGSTLGLRDAKDIVDSYVPTNKVVPIENPDHDKW